ncbi:unnamed protein product [Arabidopsis thaliana]|uniref:(thale cress) hypothetical protein n=1 Tax=Arabidopsis thaliana TaxID=3702 RepID=A0A7G2ESN9_ARATH|nr:unnamed protein product [Arabidopsis thaliana]
MRFPLPGDMGPDFVPAPRDFVPGQVIHPGKFFGQTDLSNEMHDTCLRFIQKDDEPDDATSYYRRVDEPPREYPPDSLFQ